MPQRDKAQAVEITDWEGVMTNIDSHDQRPGAMAEQVNMTCVIPGQAQCRLGMIQLTFDS